MDLANMEQAESIFEEVLELTLAERSGFLSRVCAGNAELRRRVEKLVEIHERAERMNFLPTVLEVSTEKLGDQIGRYKLLEKIGEGGCGVVYAAEQAEPVRRRVALKVIKLGMDTKAVVARFEAERQALAMMDHPNIAKVFDAGATDTGRPFFIMELVRGIRITEYCDENHLGTRERLELFIKVCHAIQHAHQKGIIHRDIKPSNILVTLHDGMPVPKVIDFGIAKATAGRLTDATVYTQLQQFIGTPAYMSPEQAELSGLDIDTRSDIYSLGVLLYELLTGQPPFDGQQLMASGIDAMRKTIREKEPTRPSTKLSQTLWAVEARRKPSPQLEKSAPSRRRMQDTITLLRGDLDWIVMKCLEKDRSRRYDTANGVAADLNRHLKNEPVTARPPSAAYRFQKAWRRNRIGFAAATAVAMALVLGTGVSTWQALKANRARNSEIKQRLAAQVESEMARHDRYVALVNVAALAWEQENFNLLRQSLADTRNHPERGFEWYYLQRLAHLHSKTFRGHTEKVRFIAFSPDGERIVIGGGQAPRVLAVDSGLELFQLVGHRDSVWSVAFSPDGRWIVTGSADKTARIWDAAAGGPAHELTGHTDLVRSVAFSRDGQRIVTGSSDHTARVWDTATGKPLRILVGHSGKVNSAVFSQDGQRVVTGSSDRSVRVWEASSGRELRKLDGHSREVYSVAFSPTGEIFVTGGVDSIAKVWDAVSLEELPLRQLEGRGTMTALAFSPDGRHIVSGSWTSTATLWDAATGREEWTIRGHVLGVDAVAFFPDGRQFVTASSDAEVKVWELDHHREMRTLDGNMTNILALAVSPDGRRIVTGTGMPNADDGTVGGSGDQAGQVWDLARSTNLVTLQGHSSGIASVAFFQDGHRIVTGSGDGTAIIWDANSGSRLFKLTGRSPINSVAVSHDGLRLVTGHHDRTASIWDLATRRELFQLIGHSNAIGAVAFSPNGRSILTGSFDRTVRMWAAADGAPMKTFDSPMLRISSVGFSPDGQRIIAGGWHSMAMVWDIAGKREPLPLIGHTAPVNSVAFSPDGKRIITGSLDKSTKVWDAATGRPLVTLKQSFPVTSAVFAPAGRSIITGSWDGTIRVWTLASPAQIAAWEKEESVGGYAR